MQAGVTARVILAGLGPLLLMAATAGQAETAAEAAAGRTIASAAKHGGLGEAADAPGTASAPPGSPAATIAALTALSKGDCFDPARARQITAEAALSDSQRATLLRLIETTADDPALLAAALDHAARVMP